MKDQNSINEKILAAEQELAALAAKRKALQDRIRQLISSAWGRATGTYWKIEKRYLKAQVFRS